MKKIAQKVKKLQLTSEIPAYQFEESDCSNFFAKDQTLGKPFFACTSSTYLFFNNESSLQVLSYDTNNFTKLVTDVYSPNDDYIAAFTVAEVENGYSIDIFIFIVLALSKDLVVMDFNKREVCLKVNRAFSTERIAEGSALEDQNPQDAI